MKLFYFLLHFGFQIGEPSLVPLYLLSIFSIILTTAWECLKGITPLWSAYLAFNCLTTSLRLSLGPTADLQLLAPPSSASLGLDVSWLNPSFHGSFTSVVWRAYSKYPYEFYSSLIESAILVLWSGSTLTPLFIFTWAIWHLLITLYTLYYGLLIKPIP